MYKLMLKSVRKSDYIFLYELLSQRDKHVNISHKKMPTYTEHVNFVKSNPYSKWYIIIHKRKKIGAIYLSKENEIGLHIMQKYESDLICLQAIKKLMKNNPRKRYLVNISPKNKKYMHIFKIIGFNLIQHTYELDNRYLDFTQFL